MLTACSGPGAANGAATALSSASAPPMASSGQAPGNQCNAQAAQFLLGQPYEASTLERARIAAGADEARMLRPDSPVTKEYKTGRLNVVVDAGQRVSAVRCG